MSFKKDLNIISLDASEVTSMLLEIKEAEKEKLHDFYWLQQGEVVSATSSGETVTITLTQENFRK